MNHAWRIEFAAAHRAVDRALDRLGSAELELRLSLLTLRATLMSCAGDVCHAARAAVNGGKDTAGTRRTATYSVRFDEMSEIVRLLYSMQFEQMLAAARQVVGDAACGR